MNQMVDSKVPLCPIEHICKSRDEFSSRPSKASYIRSLAASLGFDGRNRWLGRPVRLLSLQSVDAHATRSSKIRCKQEANESGKLANLRKPRAESKTATITISSRFEEVFVQ